MRRRVFAALAAALALLVSGTVAAAGEVVAEVRLNGLSTGEVVSLSQRPGSLSIAPADLRALGVVPPPELTAGADGLIELSRLPGAEYDLDEAAQELRLSIPAALLGASAVSLERERADVAAPTWGALVDYTAVATAGDRGGSAAATLDARVFGPYGVLNDTVIVGRGYRGAPGPVRRLNTSWTYAEPDRLRSVTVGDQFVAATSWTAPFPAAAIGFASDFALQPGYVTQPTPRIAGASGTPSVVDLYLDGVHQLSRRQPAGTFAIDHLPVVDGQGRVSLVVTDALGRQTVQSFAFYGSDQLLRPGLSAYAVQGGLLREDAYGAHDSYRHGFASALLRRGVSDSATLEWRASATAAVQEAGLGGVFKLAEIAVASAALDGSHSADGVGGQLSLQVRRTVGGASVFAGLQQAFARFRTVASQAGEPETLRQLQLGAAWTVPGLGGFAMSFTKAREARGWPGALSDVVSGAEIFAASWTQTVAGRALLTASLVRSGGQSGQTIGRLALTVPFARRSSASVAVSGQGRGAVVDAAASSAPGEQGGLGWYAQGQVGGSAKSVQGGVTYDDRLGQQGLEASAVGGSTAVRASVSGAVVWLGAAAPRLAPRLGEAFAIVSTGRPGVGVSVENRSFGRTGADGTLLVADLPAYAPVRVSLDSASLPLALDAPVASLQVTARRGFGVAVSLPVRESRSFGLQVLDVDGRPVPAGSTLRLASGMTVPIGYDGEAYLTGVSGRINAKVETANGSCSLHLLAPSPEQALEAIVVRCVAP